jgi:hypothetical protein
MSHRCRSRRLRWSRGSTRLRRRGRRRRPRRTPSRPARTSEPLAGAGRSARRASPPGALATSPLRRRHRHRRRRGGRWPQHRRGRCPCRRRHRQGARWPRRCWRRRAWSTKSSGRARPRRAGSCIRNTATTSTPRLMGRATPPRKKRSCTWSRPHRRRCRGCSGWRGPRGPSYQHPAAAAAATAAAAVVLGFRRSRAAGRQMHLNPVRTMPPKHNPDAPNPYPTLTPLTPSLHQLGEQGSTTSGGFLSLLSGEQLLIPKEEGVGSEETTPPQARLFGRALLPLSRGPCAVVEGLITRSLITPLRYFITGLSQVIKYLRGLTHNHYP